MSSILDSSAGFATLEKQLDVSAASTIAQVLGGAGILIGLIFVIFNLATAKQQGWTYLVSWLISVMFYVAFLA